MGARALALGAVAAAILVALVGLPTPASAQDVSSARSVARIQGDTRIEKLGDLNFGEIIPGNAGGTITIALDNSVTTAGSVIAAGGTPQAASFRITRQILADYPVYSGPDGTDTIELTHISLPGEAMTLRDFTTDFNRTGFFGLPAYFFQTTFDFRVAGTLDVAPDQEPGQYLGFFTVVIDYD